MNVKVARQFVARRANLIGMGGGKDRRENVFGGLVLQPVEPHVGPRRQHFGIDRMRQVFDVEYALVIHGHC
jgi:hypothetical protein